jgi:two-component system cell cycle sensor histidine kinase/response regulator CckA
VPGPVRVLILEDLQSDAELILANLRAAGVAVTEVVAASEAEYLAGLATGVDLVLADYRLPGFDAPRALDHLKERGLDIPFIVVSGTVGEAVAVEMMKQGATDYLLKDRLGRLGPAVIRALEERALREAARRAEAALRGSHLTLHALIQAAPVAIWVVDASECVTLWNPAAERIFGWTEQEVLGRALPIVSQDQLAEYHGLLQRVLGGETLPGVEVRGQKQDGRIITVSLAAAPLYGPSGIVEGTMAVVADLTERRALEEQVRHLQKMEAVGRLAGGIAHDFNNLLGVITGLTQLVLERSDLEQALRRDVQLIDATAERAALLTRQLLAFSRKQVLRPTVLSLSDLVANLEPMLRRVIRADIELIARLVPGACGVLADGSQLEQTVVNLVVNARDAMPEGGRLTIETTEVELKDELADRSSALPAGDYVRLRVTDTGIGMDAAVQAHLFEPFFTTKEPGKGTGLGLATVYGVVSQSGGAIRVSSAPGEGTTFKIYLPRVTGGAAGTASAPEAHPEARAPVTG